MARLSQLGQQLAERGGRRQQAEQLVEADAAYQLSHRPRHWDQRQPGLTEVEAGAGEHQRATGLRARSELFHQPGLADARLAADEHELRYAGEGPTHRPVEPV